MRILLLAASALALSIGTQSLAQGRGGGHGGGHAAQGQPGGGGHGRGHGRAENRGGGGQERRAERAERRVERQVERMERRGGRPEQARGNDQERRQERAERRQERSVERAERRVEREVERVERRAERRVERRAVRVEDGSRIARLNWAPSRGLIEGCPPGLARKNNGCMPPGQLRQQQSVAQTPFGNLWSYPNAQNYIYQDGYLVRPAANGRIADYIPLLGGALAPGQVWPTQYSSYQVPDYYTDYYGLPDGYDYRYADGAIYGVDPSSNLIQQVVGLITGDDWNIGQRMPEGYGVYNVPYQYRNQYYDTPESMYRYSDGYVYQVDPTTQLIQAAIQLVT